MRVLPNLWLAARKYQVAPGDLWKIADAGFWGKGTMKTLIKR